MIKKFLTIKVKIPKFKETNENKKYSSNLF